MDHQGPGWVSRILKSASRWAMALALAVAAAGSLAQTQDPVPAPLGRAGADHAYPDGCFARFAQGGARPETVRGSTPVR